MAWTRYTEADALRVCVLARLVQAGLDLQLSSRLATGLNERGALKLALSSRSLFAVVFNVGLNIDNPRKPSGPSYEVLWGPKLNPVLNEARKRQEDRAVIIAVIDLAKVLKLARSSLGEPR